MPQTIRTRQDFLAFLAEFAAPEHSQSLPNAALPDFLQANARITDMEAYYRNTNQTQPFSETSLSWQALADILQAAAVYE
ncbi:MULTISPECIES: hypothetical protein [Eikenella]|uniref:DUF7660 domain-containing protein n=1 Tax=Eikenella longinqua TaxID=1795827 RepID=A0A1A9RZ92_9NEIS|nr:MULTISPECIES: hypothetical protein [Eikenella]OAM29329.1 hypothetical protein A7P95_03710 [Eikenella longinqua]